MRLATCSQKRVFSNLSTKTCYQNRDFVNTLSVTCYRNSIFLYTFNASCTGNGSFLGMTNGGKKHWNGLRMMNRVYISGMPIAVRAGDCPEKMECIGHG